jgi:hypothetical protein
MHATCIEGTGDKARKWQAMSTASGSSLPSTGFKLVQASLDQQEVNSQVEASTQTSRLAAAFATVSANACTASTRNRYDRPSTPAPADLRV